MERKLSTKHYSVRKTDGRMYETVTGDFTFAVKQMRWKERQLKA